MGALRPFFIAMKNRTKSITHAAVIAAAYVALTHMQNLLLPGSASWAIQLRVSEALCVLAFFTPAAIPGLTLGCLLFNVTSGVGLPLDFLLGTAATVLAVSSMWFLRRQVFLGLLMPAVFNGLLVGRELTIYFGGGFWFNCGCVAAGEAIVLLVFGTALYHGIRRLPRRVYDR